MLEQEQEVCLEKYENFAKRLLDNGRKWVRFRVRGSEFSKVFMCFEMFKCRKSMCKLIFYRFFCMCIYNINDFHCLCIVYYLGEALRECSYTKSK